MSLSKPIKILWFRFFIIIYLLMILVVFILPQFSLEDYRIYQHTTSQLGAQNTPNAWIMNAVFILLSLSVWLGGKNTLHQYPFQKFILYTFCLSLTGTAIFSHAPIDDTIAFNVKEDEIHSIFASITGFSFTLLAISFYFVNSDSTMKWLAIIVTIISIVFSILFFRIPDFAGIWQRMIFISCFGWMILQFRHLLLTKNEHVR